MLSPFARNALVLGLLAAIGPFAIDMYIPALPNITASLNATNAQTQMTLMIFFVSFGVCQIVYGPVSDAVGRKAPLYFGLSLFLAGSLGCAFAPSIEWLIFFRFVQGVGGSAVMVIPRAIIRDLHTGVEATRLMSLVILVFSVSPILAPLVGSGLITVFGWRAVFFAVATATLLSFYLLYAFLAETRPPHERIKVSVGFIARSFGSLLAHGRFMGLTFIGGLGMSGFFAFLATSPFVYIDHFGLTPIQYSIAFASNAAGFIGASQLSHRLAGRFGMARTVRLATTGHAAFVALLFILFAGGVDSLPVLIGLFLAASACLGLVIPTTMVLSLEEHGPIAGLASALGGTLQMVAGAIVIAIVSQFADGGALPMVTAIAACGVGSFVLAVVTLRRGDVATQPAE